MVRIVLLRSGMLEGRMRGGDGDGGFNPRLGKSCQPCDEAVGDGKSWWMTTVGVTTTRLSK